MAHREKAIVAELQEPRLAPEWEDLRRWARSYIKRHSHRTTSNPYWGLGNIHNGQVIDVVNYLDNDDTALPWPSPFCKPETIADRAAAIMALVTRLDTLASLP